MTRHDPTRGAARVALTALLAAAAVTSSGTQAVHAAALDVQAHRGCGSLRPEGTLAAFREGIALGATTLELDAQVSADRVLVVHHDQALSSSDCRHGDGRRPRTRLIRDLDWTELATIECTPGHPLVRVDEVLALARTAERPVHLNIELKMQDPDRGVPVTEFAALLVEAIRRHDMADRTLVQSFSAKALREVRRLAPELPRSILVRRRGDYQRLVDATHARVLSPRIDGLRASDIQRFHDQGVAVIPWVVDDPAVMRRLVRWGVDGFVTDRPDLAVALRDELARLESSAPAPKETP